MSESLKYPAEGWGWPMLAKKAHYFVKDSAISACRKWMLTGDRDPHTPAELEPRKDDCAVCFRFAKKRSEKQNG